MTGVTVVPGALVISAPLTKSNKALVEFDATKANLVVTLNGQAESYPVKGVDAVVYLGAQGGGDVFVNSTNLIGIEYGYGSGNHFTGGSFQDNVFLFGDNNTLVSGGGTGSVFARGKGNTYGGFSVF